MNVGGREVGDPPTIVGVQGGGAEPESGLTSSHLHPGFRQSEDAGLPRTIRKLFHTLSSGFLESPKIIFPQTIWELPCWFSGFYFHGLKGVGEGMEGMEGGTVFYVCQVGGGVWTMVNFVSGVQSDITIFTIKKFMKFKSFITFSKNMHTQKNILYTNQHIYLIINVLLAAIIVLMVLVQKVLLTPLVAEVLPLPHGRCQGQAS